MRQQVLIILTFITFSAAYDVSFNLSGTFDYPEVRSLVDIRSFGSNPKGPEPVKPETEKTPSNNPESRNTEIMKPGTIKPRLVDGKEENRGGNGKK